MATLTRDEVKAYLRVTGDSDNALIDTLILQTERSLKTATSKVKHLDGADLNGNAIYTDIAEDPLFKIAQMQFAVHLYENRNPLEPAGNKIVPVPYHLDYFVTQIEGCGEYE